MGAEKDTLFKGLSEIYLFATVNLFLQFLQCRGKNNRLNVCIYAILCFFEGSNNPYNDI